MKKKQVFLCLLVMLLGLFSEVSAQGITVSGKVSRQASGESLAGVSISVKGKSVSTQTDALGMFKVSGVSKGDLLVFSYTGTKPVEITVGSATVLTIQLEELATATLSDVVVLGYGTQKVTKVSGAISTVKGADIDKLRPVRTEEALQGRASGVNVIQGGSPGSKPTVLIRGIPSYSGTDPIVIIDGVPFQRSSRSTY